MGRGLRGGAAKKGCSPRNHQTGRRHCDNRYETVCGLTHQNSKAQQREPYVQTLLRQTYMFNQINIKSMKATLLKKIRAQWNVPAYYYTSFPPAIRKKMIQNQWKKTEPKIKRLNTLKKLLSWTPN